MSLNTNMIDISILLSLIIVKNDTMLVLNSPNLSGPCRYYRASHTVNLIGLDCRKD
jgi:hypothetical protein